MNLLRLTLGTLAFAAYCIAQAATFTWTSPGRDTQVYLNDTPCLAPDMQARLTLTGENPPPILAAKVIYQNRVIAACWIVHPDGQRIVLLDADGDIGGIDISGFRRSDI